MQDEHIQQRTIVTQVMEKIRDLIASGRYKVGDRLPTEQELAERFGIGRSSIREAVKIFQHLGILEARVPKGTFVCARSNISSEAITWAVLLGEDETFEIIELREVLEERGFSVLVDRFQRDGQAAAGVLAQLEAVVESMRTAAESGSIEELVKADYTFHAAIIGQSGNKLFGAIYETLHSFMLEEIRETYRSMDDLLEVSRDHQEMIDAIRRKSRKEAIDRHSAHFRRVKDLLDKVKKT
jgi:GntR family transcriptional regulator, transcriptional repressor for pyruvate dehydrogenase complex